MDPFLEQQPYWGDFTPRFITTLANSLLAQLLPRHDAYVEGSSYGTARELEYPDYEPRTQRHLKVIQPRTGRVVTVIEVLSPTNKQPGEDGLDAYIEKRTEYLCTGTNLVEIDLLRGGARLPMSRRLPPGDYYVYVGRVHRKPRCQVIGWPWRRPLPAIPIPLLPDDQEAWTNLQELFQTVYEQSFYVRRLPYNQPVVPPLSTDDEAWVQERLADQGLRVR
jgi:hypothetical protein